MVETVAAPMISTCHRRRRTILGGQRPFFGRLFPQLLPQPVHAVQEILRAQLAEIPFGTNGHLERLPGLPERVVPQHRLDRRRERARPGAGRQIRAVRGVVEDRRTERPGLSGHLIRRPFPPPARFSTYHYVNRRGPVHFQVYQSGQF